VRSGLATERGRCRSGLLAYERRLARRDAGPIAGYDFGRCEPRARADRREPQPELIRIVRRDGLTPARTDGHATIESSRPLAAGAGVQVSERQHFPISCGGSSRPFVRRQPLRAAQPYVLAGTKTAPTGWALEEAEWLHRANDELLVIAMIEGRREEIDPPRLHPRGSRRDAYHVGRLNPPGQGRWGASRTADLDSSIDELVLSLPGRRQNPSSSAFCCAPWIVKSPGQSARRGSVISTLRAVGVARPPIISRRHLRHRARCPGIGAALGRPRCHWGWRR